MDKIHEMHKSHILGNKNRTAWPLIWIRLRKNQLMHERENLKMPRTTD